MSRPLPAVTHAILAGIDWNAHTDLAAELLDGGATEDEVVDAICAIVDVATPLDVLIPPPIGPLAELAADLIVPLVVRPIVKRLMDPTARAAWRAKRAAHLEAGAARRAARRAAREARGAPSPG